MKNVYILTLVLLGLLVSTGCKYNTIGENSAVNAAFQGAPKWVTDTGDLLSATGSAKIKNNNLNFATTQAAASARVELATQIATRIESKYKELVTGMEDSVNQESVQAIRNSVDQVLAGSKITNKWVSKDGVMWVLVKIQKLDTDLLKNNLLKLESLDKAAAEALSIAVDNIIDGNTTSTSTTN